MAKPLYTFPRLAAAVFCLIIGLFLWNNLTLHFAQIEEVLPTLDPRSLYQGHTLFIVLIGSAVLLAVWLSLRIPWSVFADFSRKPFLTSIVIVLFVVTFIPLFWLRFGGSAWFIISLIGISYFICTVALLVFAAWFSQLRWTNQGGLNFFDSIKMYWVRAHPWLPAALLGIAAVYFSNLCFARIPHIEDSIAQLLQARIFAGGEITSAPFTPREFFYFGFMVDVPRWFSQYPPGHPLALLPGVLADVPYLVNPLLGFLSVVLFYYLLRSLSGSDGDLQKDSIARWGSWLMALSPYVVFMSSEYMNHTTALASSLLGWLALKKGDGGRTAWLFSAGLAFGYCFATRPLEGAIFAAVGGIHLLGVLGWRIRAHGNKIILYALGFALAFSLYPLQNWFTTGSPLTTGYELTWGGTGFGLGAVNWGPAHTLGYGLVNTMMSIAGLNVYLWELPVPALLMVFIGFALKHHFARWDRAFFTAMVLVPGGYFFYYFHDYCFGPRYYYVITPMLIYFSIQGFIALQRRLDAKFPDSPPWRPRGWIPTGILLLVLQIAVAMPFRASVYADGYWGTDDGPRKEARRLGVHRAVVFIENHPWEILQTKLHSLGFRMGDAHRLLFSITQDGLNEVLQGMGVTGEELWTASPDLNELEKRIAAWYDEYLRSGNPPLDPWHEEGRYTYYSNGAVHLDPREREPDIIFARDLGGHNRVLLETHPDRKAYRYAWDAQMKRFRLLPLDSNLPK
jgi:hypothetical protein